MKHSIKIGFLFVALCGLGIVSSCTKSSLDHKLQGNWKKINLADVSDSTNVETWQFNSGGNLFIYNKHNSGETDTTKLAYTIDSYQKFVISATASGQNLPYICKWVIVKLNSKMMRMESRSGGLFIIEFEKE
ncbi:MAG: hypothetical protein WCQ95_02465 [Bacteroidota bacterium]